MGTETDSRRPVVLGALLVFILIFTTTLSRAELYAVSGFSLDNSQLIPVTLPDEAPNVAYSLANGFPIWYQDEAADGLKLELCLDSQVSFQAGIFDDPCLLGNNPSFPLSFPSNFGGEAFWWLATAFGTFSSSQDGIPVAGGDALLVQALEAAFNLGVLDGEQLAFGRIRLRISVPITGRYLVEHPYGSREYVINVPQRRAINQTQDVGNFDLPGPPPAGDFTAALYDLDILIPDPLDPSNNVGVVNEDGRTIGPFLRPADPEGVALPPVVALDGRQYLALPGTDLDPIVSPVTGAPNGNFNGLRITLLDGGVDLPIPEGFCLNGEATGPEVNGEATLPDDCQSIEFTEFQVMGKIFNDGLNRRPVARPDFIGTAINTAVRIDVAANDRQHEVSNNPVDGNNVHGINPQAIGLPVDQSPNADLRLGILLTTPHTTAQGGTVQRFTPFATGQTELIYTPPLGFSGEDSFYYVIQDTGGLISEPALVTVVVEDLEVDAAWYRTRTGKWTIAGVTSVVANNEVTLTLGPRARLSGAAEVPPVASTAIGRVTLRLGADSIEYRLQIDPLPATSITQAHIHVGGPDENGPILFFIYDGVLEPDFTGVKSGTLTFPNLIPRPAQGVSNFANAINAIMEGRTYVNVHTTANPAGEIRGQLVPIPLGTAQVGLDGAWIFEGKTPLSPGAEPRGVNLESVNGVRMLGIPLRLR